MGFIERAGNEIASVLVECCTVEEVENTLAEINPADWQRAAQKVLDLANHQGAVGVLTAMTQFVEEQVHDPERAGALVRRARAVIADSRGQ
jgi:hypothetical protein